MHDFASNESLFPLDPADAIGAPLDRIAAALRDTIVANRGTRSVDAYVILRGPASLPGETGEIEDVQPVTFTSPRGRTAVQMLADTADTLVALNRGARIVGFR